LCESAIIEHFYWFLILPFLLLAVAIINSSALKIFRLKATFVCCVMSSRDINDYANMIVKVFRILEYNIVSALAKNTFFVDQKGVALIEKYC
jgi:hypothetical protein